MSDKCPACGKKLVEVDRDVGYGDKLFCTNPDCRVISVEKEDELESDFFFEGSGIEEASE